MSESEKSTSIVSSFSSLLLKAWNEWDVRGMVLLSLLLQIILSVLGNRRKYTINDPFTRIVLWFAYLSADWVAIATLGKLSSSYPGSHTTNILKAFWAPLLIVHLGGPDTITAYAYEDNKLWARHLFILVVKVVLAIYVIFLSWTRSWLSFLTLPLVIAGIAKYVERILCLKLNNSQKIEPIFSFLNFFPKPIFEPFLQKNANVLEAYLYFSMMRPDVNNYLSYSASTARIRIDTCVAEILGPEIEKVAESMSDLEEVISGSFEMIKESSKDLFDAVTIELGLIFDFVYTKFALIYTKTGCFLRLISFACSFSVLLLFLISIMNESKFHFSRVDIYITGTLLCGNIALELYAAWVMFSSDWAILVVAFHHNVRVRKMFWVILKCFPCLLNQRKRWSNHMGQFDLLKYCWHYKKKEANKSSNDLIEMGRKCMRIKFVKVPSYLKQDEVYPSELDSFSLEDNTFKASRGKKALQARDQYNQLNWSIQLDFDYSIIIWHLATSVLYYDDESQDPKDAMNTTSVSYYHDDSQDPTDAMNISKCVSNYMMYLLAMRPTMLLPEDSKSFWLDHTYEKLKELFFDATNIKAACELLSMLGGDDHEKKSESSNLTLDNLLKDVRNLTISLNKLQDKWEMIKEVWLEMLLYAAFSSSNISHVKHLGEGGEFLSLLWLLGGMRITFNVNGS